MSDRIVLSGLEFHAKHGVFPAERELGARFVVDVELFLPMDASDELSHTVNYATVYEHVRRVITETSVQLIETLAVQLAEGILAEHLPLQRVKVRVHKPWAPLPGVFSDVMVEAERARS